MGWPLVVAYIVLLVLTTTLQILLTPKPKFEDARPKGLGDFSFPTATEDRAVPIIWGTIDVRGPNVLWYGDLMVIELKKKVGKKKQTVAFRYFVGMDLLLGYGPIDRVTQLEIGQKEYPTADMTPTMPFAPSQSGTSLVLSNLDFLGGEQRGGTVVGNFTVYSGGNVPTQNAYLQSQLGNDIPGYVNIAHVVAEQVEVGENSNIQPYVFRVTRFPNNLGLTDDNHIVNGTVTNGDANLMEMLYEVLVSDKFGLGMDPARIDLESLKAAGDTLADEGNGGSTIVDRITAAKEIVEEITRQADAVMYEDSAGKFSVALVRDDYNPATLSVFDESNISSLDKFSRVSWASTINHVNVRFMNRLNRYQESGAPANDLANVRTQGAEARVDYNYPFVKHPDTAKMIAERELRTGSFPLARFEFTANRDAASLIPGGVIKVSWAEYGIVEMIVRIMSVDLGKVTKGTVKVTGVQDVFRIAESIFAEPDLTLWVEPDATAVPFASGEELVREMPRILANLYPEDIPDPELSRIWSLLRRPAAQPMTLDAETYVDDGEGGGYLNGYGKASMAPFGLLDAVYPLETADIETSDLLGIDSEIDVGDLQDEDAAQIAQGYNLVLLEGATQAEDEIVGFEEFVDDGDGSYTLRNVHRGLMDTAAKAHAIGTRVWFFAEGPSLSDVTFDKTQAIDVKHAPNTSSGQLPVASASANALTFAKRSVRPIHPADAQVEGVRFPVATASLSANIEFTWSHREITDTIVRDADDGHHDAPVNENEDHILRILHGYTGVLFKEIIGTYPSPNWHDFTYTLTNLRLDSGEVGNIPLMATLHTIYDGGHTPAEDIDLESLQRATSVSFNVDAGLATDQSIELNGTDEYLAQDDDQTIGVTDTFSVSVWVRGDTAGDTGVKDILHLDPAASNNSRVSLTLESDVAAAKFNIALYDSSGTKFKDYSFGSYAQNTWTLLTVTWDGADLTVYQDNTDETSGATKNTDTTGDMIDDARRVILGADTTPAASWSGHIYSPAIWTSVLGSDEVITIEAGASGYNLRANAGNYVSAEFMNHLWDFRVSTAIGYDYRNSGSGTQRDVMDDAAGIGVPNLDSGETP